MLYVLSVIFYYKIINKTINIRESNKVEVTMQISIIIVTWNVESFIINCLESIYRQSFKFYEIIIIDNHSTDRTRQILKEKFPDVFLIENSENKGFAYATNQGIEKAGGNYLLCLNSDVVLEKNFLSELAKGIKESPKDVGTFTGKILDAQRNIYSTGLILTKSKRFKSETKEPANKTYIFGACAAAALYKRKMLEDIKINNEYFDNDFFFLVEDVDLSYRAYLLGWKALYLKNAICYHVGNCSNYSEEFRQYLSFRNRYFLLIKNEPFKTLIKNMLYILPYDLSRIVYLLFVNKYFFKSIKEILNKFSLMLAKRQFIQQKKLAKSF